MNASNSHQNLLPASEIVSTKLSVREPADLMSYIVHTLGFEPTRSWVGVAVREKRLGAVMRGDLPPSFESAFFAGAIAPDESGSLEQEAQYLGRFVASRLRHDADADRILLIYILDSDPDSSAEATQNPGEGQLRDALARIDQSVRHGATLEQLPVFESWVVGGRRVWHLYCNRHRFCATQGSPVGEPQGTLVSDSLTLLGQPIEDSAVVTLPDPCNDLATLPAIPDENDTVACWNWLRTWDEILESERRLDAHEAASLAAPIGISAWRDLLLVGTCFGFKNAVAGLALASRVPEGLVRLFDAEPDDQLARLAAETLTGRTRKAPEWSRMDLLRRYCAELIPRASADSAATIAAIAGWIEWARGRGSRASVLLDQALTWDSSCSLAVLLDEAVRSGLINPWALDRDVAWSGRDRSVA